ncbi:MAG: hypothetical protein KIS91_04575 [Anaerolineae bacterium]|nr:hypothetical protein [Anaerolineae bacterium]
MPFSNINASIMLGLLQVMVDRLPEYLDGPYVFADVRLLTSENLPYAILSLSSIQWHALEVQRRQGELSIDDHALIRETLARLEAIKTRQAAAYQAKLQSELRGLVDAWVNDVEGERETGGSLRALPADLERRRTQIDRVLESVAEEVDVLELRRRLRATPQPPPRRERRGARSAPVVEDEASG